MTQQRDFKRTVRARMAKTGESYTSARAALLAKRSPTPPKAVAAQSKWPNLAGKSDDTVATKTGRTWSQWVAELDRHHAWTLSHRDIAKHLGESYEGVSAWWAQTITVGYERIRGLRDVGQRRGGTYDANKSRTFGVDVSTLYRMFSDARRRRRWLTEGFVKIRTSKVDASIRLDWEGDTRVLLTFTDKGPDKSAVAIQHSRLPDKAAVDAAKEAWHRRLAALAEAL